MGYFKSAAHFVNYVKKNFRMEGVEFPGALTVELLRFYQWSAEYNKGDAVNQLTWRCKGAMSLLTPKGIGEFRDEYLRDIPKITGVDDFSVEFIDNVIGIGCVPGCYFLFDSVGTLAYVGKSIDLSSRVWQSIKDRSEFSELTHVRLIKAESQADISVIEAWAIAQYKPYLNKDQYTKEPVTVTIQNVPQLGNPIKIFK